MSLVRFPNLTGLRRLAVTVALALVSSGCANEPMTITTGQFGAHRFSLTKQGNTAVATYSPFLPRDDAAFLGGAGAAVEAAFGASITPGSATPAVDREIVVAAKDGRAFALFPIKESTGEVHSIRIRQVE